jgi:predicted kinase
VVPVSRDLIRAAMFPGDERHTAEQTELAFDAMLSAAGSLLRGGGRVSLDGCCFARPWQRESARRLALETGARLIGVHLEIPVDEASRRVARAGAGDHPANDRDAELVRLVAGYLAPPDPDDLLIDATLPADEIWELVRSLLAGGG